MRRMGLGLATVTCGTCVGALLLAGAVLKPAWGLRMDHLADLLGGLLVDVISESRFWNPENQGHLVDQAHELATLSHDVEGDPTLPRQDPAWAYLATHLSADAREAEHALKMGELGYGRALLFRVADACTACHTRPDIGVRLPPVDLGPQEALLTRWELPRFHTAVCRFDLALTEYQDLLASPSFAVDRPLEYDRATVKALTLAVRVKDQPGAALGVVDRILANPAATPAVTDRARAWRNAIMEWQSQPRPHPASADTLHQEARMLVERAAHGAERDGPEAYYVEYLRASALLHSELALRQSSPQLQETLLLLGLCYESLRAYADGMLELAYYEACIANNPSTPVARTCFNHYRGSVLLMRFPVAQWPASPGNPFKIRPDESLPMDIVRRLERLLQLMRPDMPVPPRVPGLPMPPVAP